MGFKEREVFRRTFDNDLVEAFFAKCTNSVG